MFYTLTPASHHHHQSHHDDEAATTPAWRTSQLPATSHDTHDPTTTTGDRHKRAQTAQTARKPHTHTQHRHKRHRRTLRSEESTSPLSSAPSALPRRTETVHAMHRQHPRPSRGNLQAPRSVVTFEYLVPPAATAARRQTLKAFHSHSFSKEFLSAGLQNHRKEGKNSRRKKFSLSFFPQRPTPPPQTMQKTQKKCRPRSPQCCQPASDAKNLQAWTACCQARELPYEA